MKDLPLRTGVAVLLLGLLALVLIFGGWIQCAVLGLFSALAVFEMRGVFRAKGIEPFVIPQTVLGAVMFAVLYKLGTTWLFCAFTLAFLAIAIERIINKKRTNEDLVAAILILAYPIAPLSFFGLIGFDMQGLTRLALLTIFVSVIMSDNTAYMVGSLFGKHKLSPVISPNKTVEGGVAGLIGGAVGGVIVYFAQFLWMKGNTVSLPALIVICFTAGLIGQFGDLFASTFKRWAGIKDFGKIFPGHGGIIDRLDSALFAAPVIYFAFILLVCLGRITGFPSL
ncbi:MAG: phosphatidate cytidylyltransferase [Clostridia bacterium]|nr:phosphatidate cytidylyltransferase [Clostridia bacterium]